MKKRIVAFLLCILMAVSSVPLSPVFDYFRIEAAAANRVESLSVFSSLTAGKFNMTCGSEEIFKVMVQPKTATNKTLKWTSSAASVVALSGESVSKDGIASVKLTAVKEGTSKITYSTTDGSDISGSFTVVVKPLVKSLSLSESVKSITPDSQGERLTATVSPADAGNQVLSWFSSDEDICKVDYNGQLYPVSKGECYISVATTDGSDIVKTCRLVVGNKAKSVTVSKESITLANGKNSVVYAMVVTTDGSKHDAVKWTSSNTKVATVSQDGVITAKYPGTATIKATSVDGAEKYDSCSVKVTQKITKITLKESVSVPVGTTATLSATITPTYATDKKLTWSSSDTNIVTVSSTGVVTARMVGSAKITCKNSDGSASDTCTVNVIKPTASISINSYSEELWKGDSVTLEASVEPYDASDKSVTWSSSNTKVATVDKQGVVTAVAGGSCTIKAQSSGGQTAVCKITVFEKATGIEIDEIIKTMYVGQVDKIAASVLPATATNRSVTWTSSDTSVATIEADGTIKALKKGTATITVKSADGGYKATCKLTVNPKVSVTGVTLDKAALSLKVGASFQFLGTVQPSNASERRIKWTTSDKSVATVSSTGVVKGVKAGYAVITATTYDGSYTAQCKLTVIQPVSGVTLSSSSTKISIGKSKTLTCTVSPSNASNKSVTWSSSNTKVATVTGKGVVTAKKAGTATITVKTADGGFTASCKVTVFVPVMDVDVSVTKLDVPKGQTRVVSAIIAPSDATNKEVKWYSSDTNVAKISASGKITGVAKGTAVITCKTADGGYKASCEVNVIQLAEKVKLDAVQLNLQVGKYKTVTAKVTPSSVSYTKVKWKSSDKSVVAVSSKGVVKAVGAGTATITATSADGNAKASCKVIVTQPATGVKLNKKEATVKIGKKITLKATVLPDNVSNSKVTWISSDTAKATVTSDGVVKGIKQGYVTITVKTADGKHSASCKVLVAKSVTGIKLDKNSITMNVGKSTTITPTISPKDATIKTVKWSSDNNDVATVDKNGKVTAVGAGYATITATTSDGSFKAKTSVYAIKPVKSVSLNKKTIYLDIGEKFTLKPVFNPKDATIRGVTWTSSDKKVATVSSNGVVKGKKLGTATITCTTNNGRKVATCKVYVVKRVTDVTLNRSNEILYLGDTLKLKTTIYPADATVKTYTYKSSDTKVAKVSSKGVITPLNVGTAKITVVTKDGSHKATCKITVKKAPEKLTLKTTSAKLKVGEKLTIKYTVYPTDATNRKATFKSSDPNVVYVSKKGVIKGISKGSAKITVMTENGIKKTLKVTVRQQVTSVEVTPSATVYTGKTLKLKANVLPEAAQNKKIKWSSSDTSVVKVTSDGVITGMRAGTATVTVTSEENSKLRATCKVTVKQHVTSLKFEEKEIYLNKGAETDLKYTVLPADATNKKVTFTSSDSSVVSVSKDGRITAHKGGKVKITVTSADNKDLTAICYVIAGEPASGVSLNYSEKSVYVGSKLTLQATVSPSDAHNKLVRWSSSDAAKASVDSKGVVTVLKSGKATITATTVDGGYKASCVLTLLQRATKLETPVSTLKINRGNTYQLSATVLPADCYNKSYKWTSADTSIAAVTADGLITAVKAGTVKLTCTSLENSAVKATVTLTVHEPVTSVEISESEATLYTPFSKKLTATVLPENASDRSVTWTSSDTSVVKVDNNGNVTAVGKGEATVTVKSNDTGKTDICKFVIFTGVEDIIVEKSAYSLHENTSLRVGYALNPENADDPRITFISSDEEIFCVTDDGTITGIRPGEATLTVASVQNPAVKKEIPVKITRAVTGISLDTAEKTLFAGNTFILNATVTPADASDKTVIWTSSDSKVLSVDASGKVTAVSRGFAEITAQTKDGGFIEKCSFEVIQLPEEVASDSDAASVYLGQSLTLNMTVLPEDTNDKTLTWKSTDESIATVDQDGKVTPIKLGTCYIVASSIAEGVEKRVELSVLKLSESVEIDSRIPELFEGQKLRLLPTVLPEDASDKTVQWTSSDSDIVSVDKNGIITAVKPGRATVTATASDGSGATKTVEITVVAPISGITLPEAAKQVELGEGFTLTATVQPEMAYDKTVTYSSSDSEVATVDADGKVSALKTGTAVITATTADGKFSAKLTLTVVISAEEIRIGRNNFTLSVGNRVKVEYEVLPVGTTQSEVIWTSSDASVAKADSNGVITATGIGTATITVTVKGTDIKNTVTVTVQ